MYGTILLMAALASATPVNCAGDRQDGPLQLTKYVDSLHWDAAKSGPLIVLEPDTVFSFDGPATKLSAYKMKMAQTGKLSVIAQNWTIALPDDEIPNPYQALSDEEKLCFLLATLNPNDLDKLVGRGISASELSGEQRQALLSMIPDPLRYMEGTAQGNSFTGGDAVALPDDQRAQVRVQLHKGISVTYAANSVQGGGNSYPSIDSLVYRTNIPIPAVSSVAITQINDDVKLPGRVMDSVEKKSDLAWNDPRLAQPIKLAAKNLVGPIVDNIRSQTGVDLYADARIERLPFNAYGPDASAGDLLHGLAIALCGTVRRVGSAYILTADKEGTAARSTRLRARLTAGKMEIEARVASWRASVKGMRLTQSIPFAVDDTFHGGSIAAADLAPSNGSLGSNWVSVSQLPSELQATIASVKSSDKGDPTQSPVAGFAGKARVSAKLGYRLVLPDGRPLEFNAFDPAGTTMVSMSTTGAARQEFPVDLKWFRPGTAVAIKSDDPQTVARLCGALKEFKVSDIWLESLSPSAIKAAVASGVAVNLIVRPWRALKGEVCPDPDRNQIALTGGQLNGIPTAKYDPVNRRTESFGDSFCPDGKDAAAHIERVSKLASVAGIRSLVLMDAQPGGYQAPVAENNHWFGDMTVNGILIHPGLQDVAPDLFEFGYTANLRAEFLRAHHLDPVDLDDQVGGHYGPISPYFESPGPIPVPVAAYPNVHFPPIAPFSGGLLGNAWEALRYDEYLKRLPDMVKSFSALGKPVYVEGFTKRDAPTTTSPIWFVAECGADGKPDAQGETNIRYVSINPLNAEDEAGNIDFNVRPLPTDLRFCFDLTEVPTDRFVAYLRYLLKAAH